MKYYIIAGEASGMHGSNLIKELKNWIQLLQSVAGAAIKWNKPVVN